MSDSDGTEDQTDNGAGVNVGPPHGDLFGCPDPMPIGDPFDFPPPIPDGNPLGLPALDGWAWRGPPSPRSAPHYALANKILPQDLNRSNPLHGDNKYAEEVYDIPELRDMIFEAFGGRQFSKALATCLGLDRRGFESAVPCLYRYTPLDIPVILTEAGVAYVR